MCHPYVICCQHVVVHHFHVILYHHVIGLPMIIFLVTYLHVICLLVIYLPELCHLVMSPLVTCHDHVILCHHVTYLHVIYCHHVVCHHVMIDMHVTCRRRHTCERWKAHVTGTLIIKIHHYVTSLLLYPRVKRWTEHVTKELWLAHVMLEVITLHMEESQMVVLGEICLHVSLPWEPFVVLLHAIQWKDLKANVHDTRTQSRYVSSFLCATFNILIFLTLVVSYIPCS